MADTPAESDRVPYETNIGRLIKDYPDFVICADVTALTARTRTSRGSAGPELRDASLDGLAAQMDACRRRVDGV